MPKLKATRIRILEDSGDLARPGDLCVRELPSYNSSKIIHAVVMKCPYCNADMASVPIHRIRTSTGLRLFLSRLGFPAGITVTPKLACPYAQDHIFSITNGRIKPAQ